MRWLVKHPYIGSIRLVIITIYFLLADTCIGFIRFAPEVFKVFQKKSKLPFIFSWRTLKYLLIGTYVLSVPLRCHKNVYSIIAAIVYEFTSYCHPGSYVTLSPGYYIALCTVVRYSRNTNYSMISMVENITPIIDQGDEYLNDNFLTETEWRIYTSVI